MTATQTKTLYAMITEPTQGQMIVRTKNLWGGLTQQTIGLAEGMGVFAPMPFREEDGRAIIDLRALNPNTEKAEIIVPIETITTVTMIPVTAELLYTDAGGWKDSITCTILIPEDREIEVILQDGQFLRMGTYGAPSEEEFFMSEVHPSPKGEDDHNLFTIEHIEAPK